MTLPRRKLLYILNSFSPSDSSHFAHVGHLLEVMAQDCEITLLVEKASILPTFEDGRVSVLRLRSKRPIIRHVELFLFVVKEIRRGTRRTFIRISAPAAIVASVAHRMFGGKTFLWQSGATYERDWAQPLSLKKVKWFFSSFTTNWCARKLVTHFVTGPESMLDYYENVVGVPRRKMLLLYNDVELARFRKPDGQHRERTRQQLGVSSGEILLLLVHRLSPVRRTRWYLEPLLATLQESSFKWRLVVLGSGDEFSAIKNLIDKLQLGEYCQLVGEVPNNEIQRFYGAADIFIQPSFIEGFPRTLIEAMAAGLPIASTDAGGVVDLIGKQQKAYVSDRNRPEKFAESVLRLMELAEDRRGQLGEENFAEVQRFSTPRVASMYVRTLFRE